MNRNVEKLGFIGAGNMASALIKGLLDSGLYQAGQLTAYDTDGERLKEITRRFDVRVSSSNCDLVKDCQAVVLAVKPQSMREVLEVVREDIADDLLMISIAAGIPLRMIQSVIGRDIPLIRVMPNTPALIQRGISALAAGTLATPDHMEIAGSIFEAVGEAVTVSEDMMDAVTAISGSGPGYFFRLMECFVDAAEKIGFDRSTSLRLVMQTALGAVHLASTSEKSLGELREMVTSPGGTTAAALAVFEEKRLANIIEEAVKAALDRGVELGKNY